jgi:hypothetical protein
MFLPLPLIANFQALQDKRQSRIDLNLLQTNAHRKAHDYQPGDQVLVLSPNDIKQKLDAPTEGPFIITAIHTNATVTIQRRLNVFERLNIRRIKPAPQLPQQP